VSQREELLWPPRKTKYQNQQKLNLDFFEIGFIPFITVNSITMKPSASAHHLFQVTAKSV
jgi:hypothetical protein